MAKDQLLHLHGEKEINQYKLSEVCDFIPEIHLSQDGTHSSQFLEGAINWEEVFHSQTSEVPFTARIEIALEIVGQLEMLAEKYGIFLADRHNLNIMLQPTNNKSSIVFGNMNWKVFQVDTEFVYDAVKDTEGIKPDVNLRARRGTLKVKNERNEKFHRTGAVMTVLKYIIESIKNLPDTTAKRNEGLQRLNLLDSRWRDIWASRKDNFEEITFKAMRKVLESLR